MEGFNPEIERVEQVPAGMADGSIVMIERRILLTPDELKEKKRAKTFAAIAALEEKLIDGTITEFEMTKLNALTKLV
jgi:hypothetical protein